MQEDEEPEAPGGEGTASTKRSLIKLLVENSEADVAPLVTPISLPIQPIAPVNKSIRNSNTPATYSITLPTASNTGFSLIIIL